MKPTAHSVLAAALLLLAGTGAAPAAPMPDEVRSGAEVYDRCVACHALGRNRTGPRHCGVVGRPAGSVPGYDYSEAMRRAGLVWTPVTLDRFLTAPLDVVPGTTMGYSGISDPAERAALIAYLDWASANDPACR